MSCIRNGYKLIAGCKIFTCLREDGRKIKCNKKNYCVRSHFGLDCLYLFINFIIKTLFKVAHLYFLQLLCILKMNELKFIVPFFFSFWLNKLKAEQILIVLSSGGVLKMGSVRCHVSFLECFFFLFLPFSLSQLHLQ